MGFTMTALQSTRMQLSASERTWLPWFGKAGKLAMGWSCWLNRSMYTQVEQAFEGIAQTRVNLLQNWTASQWKHLAELAEGIGLDLEAGPQLLRAKLEQMPDISELFLVNDKGQVIASTWAARNGARDLPPQALSRGLREPFLHGPYSDPQTLAIGPSTSRFHDAVTLMFYQPLMANGRAVGCLCGRGETASPARALPWLRPSWKGSPPRQLQRGCGGRWSGRGYSYRPPLQRQTSLG